MVMTALRNRSIRGDDRKSDYSNGLNLPVSFFKAKNIYFAIKTRIARA